MSTVVSNLRQNVKHGARLSQPWNLPRTASDASDRDFWVWADPSGLFWPKDLEKPPDPPPPPPPTPEAPTPMPDPEDPAARAETRRRRARRDRGRASTILSDLGDQLGGS